jgi:hypothetical protein
MFFSAAKPGDAIAALEMNMNEVLVSYHYIRKRKQVYDEEFLPLMKEKDGLFMTDSGAFSLLMGKTKDEYYTPEFWTPYLEEYVQWLWDHKDHIYNAANLDLDIYVGRDQVDKWNDEYFKPLEEFMNVIYVTHKDWKREYGDPTGLKRFKEYLKIHNYVGVNAAMKDQSAQIAALSRAAKKRVHGFAWTSIPLLRSHPVTTVDSSTWLGAQKFGSTYIYDGKNLRTFDFKNKFRRKKKKFEAIARGLDWSKIEGDEDTEMARFNLMGWEGGRREYLRSANTKLWNQPIDFYDVKKYGKR